MSLYSTFKTDEKIETDGVTLEYGSNDAGKPIRIRVARAGGNNTKYAKILELRTKPYRRQLQNEILDPKIADEVFRAVYAESVVLGWENVEDENGTPMPFNRDNCIKLFKDLPDLFADVREQAQKAALFRRDLREIESGN